MDSKIYNEIVKEHFDITDKDTRKVIVSLNEDQQNQLVTSLSAKLYTIIVSKVDEIDYGKIPESRGDITKIPNFQELNECIDTIRKLLIEYKQPTDSVDAVFEAIENLKDSRQLWEKAFTYENNLAIVFYNTIALSIVSSVSFLISGSIDFIKDPDSESYEVVLDTNGFHKSKDNLLFKNLKKFNKSYRKGEIQKAIKASLESGKNIKESSIRTVEESIVTVAATTVLVLSLAKLILPILHELVCMLYCARQNMSDYMSIQSDLVRLNAENVKFDTTKTPEERKKIYNRQSKIADKFKKISNKLAVKIKSTQTQAEKLIAVDNKTAYKIKPGANDAETITPASIF